MQNNIPLLANTPVAGLGGLFVSPGYGRHPDRVMDSWELIFVRKGRLHIEEDGVEFLIMQGESVLLLPTRRHRGLSEHSEDLSFYWVHFTLGSQHLPTPLELPQHARLSRPERLAAWFHEYVADQTLSALTRLASDAMLLLMLNETMLPSGVVRAENTATVVRNAEEYISHHLRRGIGPGEVAQAFSYNTAHLSRLFRQVHGVTLGGFIHRVQLVQARTLLQNSTSSVKQIAAQCGFSEAGYFRRLFHRELGVSPSEYRKCFGQVRINRT